MSEHESTTEGVEANQALIDEVVGGIADAKAETEAGIDAVAAAQGNLEAAPDNVKDISQAKPPKMSKQQMKQAQQFEERIRRFENKGLTRQQAMLAIQREDYEALPDKKKIKRLEGIIQGIAQQLGQDITNLRFNDNELADALDINFTAFAEMLIKLGISREEQDVFVRQAAANIAAKKQAEAEEQQRKQAAAQAASQDKSVEQEAKEADAAGTPHVPEEATTFG